MNTVYICTQGTSIANRCESDVEIRRVVDLQVHDGERFSAFGLKNFIDEAGKAIEAFSGQYEVCLCPESELQAKNDELLASRNVLLEKLDGIEAERDALMERLEADGENHRAMETEC